MKNMIKVFGIIVLLALIGLPVMAQPTSTHSSSFIGITPQTNAISNLFHRQLTAGEKQYFRINNLSDSFYYIFWRDADSPANLQGPAADVKVTVLNLSRSTAIVSNVDVNPALNEEGVTNSIEIRRDVHYMRGDDILIIVEGMAHTSDGHFAILVY